ncbi:MAG: right-handed parallel beta-helix repeat-containing protein [Clostridia bacterium]|nr:right-handed parallel beta-helix repeat-containing protein [Clostridia bacterium]
MHSDLSAVLPDGNAFAFWEKETPPLETLFVDGQNPLASDDNDGSAAHPFKTIQRAADLAKPGDLVRVHAGLYREAVHPRRGGEGPERMIRYEAFGDGPVIIRASEEVRDFAPSTGWRLGGFGPQEDQPNVRIWTHRLDPDMFRGYNPFCAVNILHDRLFIEYDKTDMTPYLNRRGCVFCDGKPLKQVALYRNMGEEDNTYWVEHNGQTIHFRLTRDEDPKEHLIEITVREQCFAPEEPFVSYIKVKGFVCEHAATGAPVPQRGAISAYRGHHWVIEDCEVNWSNGVAMDVGNECWHHERTPGEIIGHSVIRGCTIRDAGVCGIAGLFAEEMLIEDNVIEGTGWQKMELSWEAGAIKLHNSVNALIRRNVFKNTLRADHLWLDCGNENNRITGNLFLNGIEQREAIFIECTRDGVNLIDNNIIWNVEGRFDPKRIPAEPGSSGWYKLRENDVVNGYAVYAEGTDQLHISHNLIGRCRYGGYYAKPVSFRFAGLDRGGTSRKAVITNNIFYDCGEAAICFPTADNQAEGNLYVKMQGGYLRVMYPEPENCLNLPAWREFYGFDLTGQNAWLDMALEGERFTLTKCAKPPFGLPGQLSRLHLILSPEDIQPVAPDPLVSCDHTGSPHSEGPVLPGPYSTYE